MKKIFNALENFWYHYKWVTLIVLFFAVGISIMLAQMITKNDPDSTVLYGGPAVLTADACREVGSAFASVMPSDFDGDGQREVTLDAITVMTNEQLAAAESAAVENSSLLIYDAKSLYNNKTNFATRLFSGDSIICLIDKAQYKAAHDESGFVPLSELFQTDKLPDGRYDDCALIFSETGFARFFTACSVFPEDTLLCVRKMSAASAISGKDKSNAEYKKQLSLYYAVVSFSLSQTADSVAMQTGEADG